MTARGCGRRMMVRFTGWCQTLEVPAEVLRNNILQKASYFGLLGRLKGKNREIISQKQITPNILYSTAMGWAKRRAFVIKFPWVLLSKDKFQILYWTRAWTLFFSLLLGLDFDCYLQGKQTVESISSGLMGKTHFHSALNSTAWCLKSLS